jgi:aspartate aminotransferase
MTMKLASRLSAVKPSITLAVTAKAKQLRAEGVDVVGFGAGEPDFDTPEHIKQAGRDALDGSAVAKYTMVAGIPELRKAVVDELGRAHGVDLSPDQVLVSCGAKHSLFNIFMAMLDEGDEVVIPAPYWVSYPDMVRIAGGTPVIVETTAEGGFAMEAEAFRSAITDRTRALVLCTPSNPTGAVYNRTQLEAIAKLCIEHDIYVISDDIYRSLVYGKTEYVSIASLSPEMAKRTIMVDGVSKTYAMTGYRIGYAAGPIELIKAMSKIQGQSTSNPTHLAQLAALAAITGPQECVGEMRKAFDERRLEIVERLRAIPGVECPEPHGAFYVFPDFSAFLGKKSPDGKTMTDDVALCEYLVEVGQVAVVPGSAFGAPGFLRLSYACSLDDVKKGVQRIKDTLSKLE